MPDTPSLLITDPDMMVIQLEKESAFKFRQRRHEPWRNSYTLYRDTVIANRLTQRQTVNIPLMKYAIGSLMKEIDEPPALYYKNLDNNEQKEVFYNEYWKDTAIRNKLPIRDIMDKKQALLYGRTFKKLNRVNGEITIEIVDPQDMLVERFVDPADMDTARVVIQTNIFRTLSEITKNPSYRAGGKRKLKTFFSEQNESLEQDNTLNKILEKNQRLLDMGLDDVLDPLVGETYIELNEVYRREYSAEDGATIIFLYTVATPGGAVIELQKRKLYEVIGDTVDNFWHDHFPYNSWATDGERTDFWSDAPADILRGSNNVLNAWYSQLVENRTLRNYNMHYYDSSLSEAFVPQTFEAVPWGWYPVPGKPSEVMETVQVPDLSESLEEIDYVVKMAEKAVAATAAQTGEVERTQTTLGEVELALANARERIQSIAVFYTEGWKDFGMKYIKMLEASGEDLEPVTINKDGRLGKKVYQKEISPKQWMSRSGYTVEVITQTDRQESQVDTLQKLNATLAAMPQNAPLRAIYNKKLLEFAGLTIEERAQVEEFESQNIVPNAIAGEAMEDQPTGGEEESDRNVLDNMLALNDQQASGERAVTN